jgi:hypothetical protein
MKFYGLFREQIRRLVDFVLQLALGKLHANELKSFAMNVEKVSPKPIKEYLSTIFATSHVVLNTITSARNTVHGDLKSKYMLKTYLKQIFHI